MQQGWKQEVIERAEHIGFCRVREKVRTTESVDWHLVNTSYIMRHLQLSTTCCYASQTAPAVKTLSGVCECLHACVCVCTSQRMLAKGVNTVNIKGIITSWNMQRPTHDRTTFIRPSVCCVWLEAQRDKLKGSDRAKGCERKWKQRGWMFFPYAVKVKSGFEESSDQLNWSQMKTKAKQEQGNRLNRRMAWKMQREGKMKRWKWKWQHWFKGKKKREEVSGGVRMVIQQLVG